MGRARALIFAGALVALVAVPQQAGAQYPPAPVNPECHVLIGGVGTSGGRIQLPYLGFFQVQGEAGCTEGNSLIIVDGQSHRHNLHPGFRSNPDGSFLSPRIQLSPHMTPGPHNIIQRFTVGNVEYFCPILVLAGDNTNGNNNNDNGGGGGGGRTLNNVANRDGGGGGGALPKTGAGILMLILWALALIALGTALVFAARRRGVLRIQPLRVVSTRLRRRRHLPLALPPPDVPFIDTAGFVPVGRSKPTEVGPVTEADVQHDPKSWDD